MFRKIIKKIEIFEGIQRKPEEILREVNKDVVKIFEITTKILKRSRIFSRFLENKA